MSREEFQLVMTAHQKWNEVETKLVESEKIEREHFGHIEVQRKQNVLVNSEAMRFEISGYSILLPHLGPYAPAKNFSLSYDQNGFETGLFETMTEVKRYVTEFERARLNWELISGNLGLSEGHFERYISYGRTMDSMKVRCWSIPTSDSASLESFTSKMEALKYVPDENSWSYDFFQHKLTCKLLREASHSYPGLALDNAEFVRLIKRQLIKALLKQIIMFSSGEYTFDETGPLDQICSLINEFHLPSFYDAIYPTIDGPVPKKELKLPIVTTVLTQGAQLPVNFVNLRKKDGSLKRRGGIILNMETRTLITEDFTKYKKIFAYTRKTNTLSGWLTDDIMKLLAGDSRVRVLEHENFCPLDVSPLVKIKNPFPEIKVSNSHISEDPRFYEEVINPNKVNIFIIYSL